MHGILNLHTGRTSKKPGHTGWKGRYRLEQAGEARLANDTAAPTGEAVNIKDRIFDLLQGTYGLDADAIVDRLVVPPDEVRKAAGEMLAEGRLWETSEGRYRCVLPPPPWLDFVRELLDCEGWPGLAYFYVPEDGHLELYPAPFIREGDKAGGICFMGHWHLDLEALLGLFDGQPAVAFGATDDGTSLSVEGTIKGVNAWVEIRDRPPDDIPPDLLMTTDGGFRELTEGEQDEYAARHLEDDGEDDEPPRLHGLWTPRK